MPTVVHDIKDLKARVGEHLGHSDWHEVTQDQVNRFAEATGDHQWIHVDVERACAGPFGRPIAHGYLTLSLLPVLLPEVLCADRVGVGLNYGLDRVRFPSPVPVGTRVRVGVELVAVHEISRGVQATLHATFEVEGQEKPACVADAVFRFCW